MITSADVLAIAPELGTASAQAKVPTSPTGDQIVTDVLATLSSVQWSANDPNPPTRYDLACKYLAAHVWALAVRGAFGAGGPVMSEMVGSVQRMYMSIVGPGMDPDLDQTPYGKRYKSLRNAMLPQRIGLVP